MLAILLADAVALIALDQLWFDYGWPTILGVAVLVVGCSLWAALWLIENRIRFR